MRKHLSELIRPSNRRKREREREGERGRERARERERESARQGAGACLAELVLGDFDRAAVALAFLLVLLPVLPCRVPAQGHRHSFSKSYQRGTLRYVSFSPEAGQSGPGAGLSCCLRQPFSHPALPDTCPRMFDRVKYETLVMASYVWSGLPIEWAHPRRACSPALLSPPSPCPALPSSCPAKKLRRETTVSPAHGYSGETPNVA